VSWSSSWHPRPSHRGRRPALPMFASPSAFRPNRPPDLPPSSRQTRV